MCDTRENAPVMQFAHSRYITNRLDKPMPIRFAPQIRRPLGKSPKFWPTRTLQRGHLCSKVLCHTAISPLEIAPAEIASFK